MKVLLTGAAGRLGKMLLAARELRRFHFVPTDILTDGIDITRNLEDLVKIATGTDAVIHLAGNHHVDASWADLGANIAGTYNVFEAARRAGCKKVLFASSRHAETPSTLYGASKAFGEALGRVFAGRGLDVVCLRLGWVGGHPEDPRTLPEEKFVALIAAWLDSPVQGFEIALSEPGQLAGQ